MVRTCDECGATVSRVFEVEPENGYFQVKDGLCLDLTGHYGGFDDDVGSEPRWTVLCHDCSANLMKTLPNATKRALGQAHHTIRTDGKPCCEYSAGLQQDDIQAE